MMNDPKTIDSFAPAAAEAVADEWTFTRPSGVPVQGIYVDKSYQWYQEIEAIRASQLKVGYYKSAKHMRSAIDGEYVSDSRDRKFGRAVHIRLLEPHRYRTDVLFSKPCAAILKTGQRKGDPCGCEANWYSKAEDAWFCGTHNKAVSDAAKPDKADYVSPDEAERIEKMVEAIRGHRAVKLLRQHGGCEVSLIWDDECGIVAKARLDKHILGQDCPDTIADIKKAQTGALDEDSLQKSIRRWGYDIAAFWYKRGAETITGEPHNFLWIFIEDGPPFDVVVKAATAQYIELGRCKVFGITGGFTRYKHGLRTGEWPGTSDQIEAIYPAAWECKAYGIH